MHLMNRLSILAGIACGVFANAGAHAQNYPSRAVTIIMPTGPGGGMETMARVLATKLEQRLGKPFVIENRPGAGGIIGANAVARANPDGYTLLVSAANLASNVSLYKSLPFDPAADLSPVLLHALSPWVLVLNPSLPVQSAGELVTLAKSKPGELSFGSAGPGTMHHLFAEMLVAQTGIKVTHVPYRSTMQPLNDIIAGHLHFMFSDLQPAQGLIKAGKLRALGVSSKARLGAAPEIPPLAETGVPGFEAFSWHMIAVPAGTPKEIVDMLHAELKSIMALPEVKQQFIESGYIPFDSPSPEELQKFLKSEIARWSKIVGQAGATGMH
jgi:tripartite-type tricarboxylate transporter receptor subunit TctC